MLQGGFHWLGLFDFFSFKRIKHLHVRTSSLILENDKATITYPDLTHLFFLWKTENRWCTGVNYMFKIQTKTLKQTHSPFLKWLFFSSFFLFFLCTYLTTNVYIFNDRVSQGQLSYLSLLCHFHANSDFQRKRSECRSVELSSGSSTIELSHNKFPVDGGALAAARV